MLIAALSCREDTGSPMEPAPTTAPTSPEAAVSATAALAFFQLSAGFEHTCGVTNDFKAYCWGQNGTGQTGNGTFDNCSFGCPVFYPTPVKGGLSFKQVDAGTYHTCGVTPANRAYCWGYGRLLGTGTTADHLTPAAVAGARSFRQVSAGGDHSCGVATDDRAYCWGENARGQLGDGTTTFRAAPVAVLGSLHFVEVRAGNSHTCGVTTDNRAFCWGDNQYGEVGDSSTAWKRLKPVQVAGTGQYRRIDAGGQHTCAVTTTDRAFCWGRNGAGALGDGTQSQRRWPKAVAGGLAFNRVTAGGSHTCALTPSNRAYCWGAGGKVGDGTNVNRLKPVAVAGGFSFRQVSAGGFHTCAKDGASAGYCWGSNDWNQLGDGMVIDSYTPSPVTGPAATVALR